MYKKLLYSAPEAELLVVKFEENIMSPTWSNPNQAGTMGDEDSDNTFDF